MKASQENIGIVAGHPITIEVSANDSRSLLHPMTDIDLLEALRQIEPNIVWAAWDDVPQVEETGMFRAAYVSSPKPPISVRTLVGTGSPPRARHEWKELTVWVVSSEVAE